MSDKVIDWYLESIRTELEHLRNGRFTGNIQVGFNLKDGGVANINIGLNKSIKMPQEVYR